MFEIAGGVIVALLLILLWYEVNILPYVFLGGIIFMLIRLTSGRIPQLNAVGNKPQTSSNIAFEQIGGQEVAKKELLEALDFIKRPQKIKEMGIRPLKGLLLIGPPGTGKTLLAKAAANYTDSVFLSSAGSEFIEMYAGVGAQRVRQLFKQCRDKAKAQKKKSAVLFIDEIDILGTKRGSHGSHMEYDQTLNQLLTEMDGMSMDDEVHILVIGATNRPEALDPALVRPGRTDRIVQVELPDLEGRMEIIKLHTRNKPMDEDVDLEKISRDAYGFSGAQMESLANEAAILAMREGEDNIKQNHFMEAIDKVMMGEKQERKPDETELWRIAIHECGHAMVSELTKPGSVSVVTITPRGKALGYIRQHPEKEYQLYTREYLDRQICVLLGGAVSEKLILGQQSTGSFNDFKQAVEVSRKIIASGLSSLGVVCMEDLSGNMIHRTVKTIISEQENRVTNMLSSYLSLIKDAATLLVEKEKISGDYLREVMSKIKDSNLTTIK